MEKALFHGFWEHEEKVSVKDINVVIFNNSVYGMKTEMTEKKADQIISMLNGDINIPQTCTDNFIKKMINLSDSFGIVAFKLGCSPINKNFLLDGFVKDKCVFSRSLTKEYFLSACIDNNMLVGAHFLKVVNLHQMNHKIITRRKPGRPQTTSSIHRYLNKVMLEEKELIYWNNS